MEPKTRWHSARILSELSGRPHGLKIRELSERCGLTAGQARDLVVGLVSRRMVQSRSEPEDLNAACTVRIAPLSRKRVLDLLTGAEGVHAVIGSMAGLKDDSMPAELGALGRTVVLVDRQADFSKERLPEFRSPDGTIFEFQNRYTVDGGYGDLVAQRRSYSPYFKNRGNGGTASRKNRLMAVLGDANSRLFSGLDTLIDNSAWHFIIKNQRKNDVADGFPGSGELALRGELPVQKADYALMMRYISSVKRDGLVLVFSRFENSGNLEAVLNTMQSMGKIDFCKISRTSKSGLFHRMARWTYPHLYVIRPA